MHERSKERKRGETKVVGVIAASLLITAINTLPVGAAQRIVLGEEFTATWCGNCPFAGAALSQLLDAHPNTFAFVQYHHWDSYAQTWGENRFAYYQGSPIPDAWFDGKTRLLGEVDYEPYHNALTTRESVTTDVVLQLNAEQLSGPAFNISVSVGIEAGGQGKTMRIFVVQALDHWPTEESHYRNCFIRDVMTQDVSLSPGNSQIVATPQPFVFDSDSWSHQSNIRIIAWAEKLPPRPPVPDTVEVVYQAAVLSWPLVPVPPPLGDMDGNKKVDVDDVDDFVLALMDPAAYQIQYPTLDPVAQGDINKDSALNGNDIALFIRLVMGQSIEPVLGDMDGNFAVNTNDIDDFVLALMDPVAYQTLHPGVDPIARGDMNGDGLLNGNDIQQFILAIF